MAPGEPNPPQQSPAKDPPKPFKVYKDKSKDESTLSDAQRGTQNFLKLILIIIPIIVLGWAAYMVFLGSDPRRGFTGPDDTLQGYGTFVEPYIGPMGRQPDESIVSQWLSFFDSESQSFFEENCRTMARLRFQFDEEALKALGNRGIRSEAMKYLLTKEPLNGVVTILEQRSVTEQEVMFTVQTRTFQKKPLQMRKSGGIWVITQFGGIMPEIRTELQNFEKYNPEKPEK